MHFRLLLILTFGSLFVSLLTLHFTIDNHTHRSWLDSTVNLEKDRAWFALKINAGPALYHNNFETLPKDFPLPCLPKIYEGDLIHIIFNHQNCIYRRYKLTAQQRLALKLRISINHASRKDLRAIPGIGPQLATQIISHRPWTQLSDLKRLKGVGEKRFRKLKHYLQISAAQLLWPTDEDVR